MRRFVILYPLVQRKRKSRRHVGPGVPNGLLITQVQRQTDGLRIYFAGNVAWNGLDVPSAFRADTSDGPLDGCINVLGTGPNWIEVEFNGSVSVGADWEVDAPMAGISPAVAYPQLGKVTA